MPVVRSANVFSGVRVERCGERIVDDVEASGAIESLRKIALPLRQSGNRIENLIGARLPSAFKVEKEKRLVLAVVNLRKHNGSADISTEDITLEQCDRNSVAI